MNSIRSTERSLKLLRFKSNKTASSYAGPKVAGSVQGSMINPSLQKIYRRAMTACAIRGPRIKFIDVSSNKYKLLKNLSTSPTDATTTTTNTTSFPIINPDKPDPDYEKPIEPIQCPLTMPRFSGNKNSIPSVTKVLQATMPAASAYILDKWKEAMIKKLGAAGFAKYQKETFERGHVLHALVANYLLGSSEPVQGEGELSREIVSNLWKSIEKVVKEKISNVRLIEHTVNHPTMRYRGIVDCVACFNNQLVVIDFKTSEKPKKTVESLYDNPLQITAYCGAINNDKNIPLHVIDRNICAGVVIVAYIDGSEASTYFIGREQIDDYWKQWTTRLNQYVRMDENNKPKVKL